MMCIIIIFYPKLINKERSTHHSKHVGYVGGCSYYNCIINIMHHFLRNTKRNGVHRKTTTQARVVVHQRYAILFYYLLAYAHTK